MKHKLPHLILRLLAVMTFTISSYAQEITSFTLIDAVSDTDLFELNDGATINLSNLTNTQLNVRANVNGTVASIAFKLDGTKGKIENVAPYALFGNRGSDYNPWQPTLMTYSLVANIHSSKNGEGVILNTKTISFTVVEDILMPPTAPSNLIGEAIATDQVTINWQDNSNNEDAFIVEYNPNQSNTGWQVLATLPANSISYNDDRFVTSWQRYYRVNAQNTQGASPYTETIEVTNLPVPPTDFVITNVTATSFDLSWQPAPYGNDYLIERATSPDGPYTYFDALYFGYDSLSYSGLEPDTTYYFRMLTNYDAASSAWSELFLVTTLPDSQAETLEVTSLVLINADTDTDIATINEGDVFILEDIGTNNLNIRAEVSSTTESVIFGYQNTPVFQTENLPVYAIGGNTGNDYKPWIPDLGSNTLTATAYSEDRGNGSASTPLTINFSVLETSETLPVVLRINAGGSTVNYGEAIFLADDYFAGNGKSYANNNINDILNTDRDDIYKTERSTNANLQSFNYAIPVTNGEYEVNLHFAEIYFGATGGGAGGIGKRVFNVSIEGVQVLTNFDLNAEEASMTAIIKPFVTNVTDEILNIDFSASVNQPKVSAIEIFGNGSFITPTDDCTWNALANSNLSKVEAQSVKVNGKLYVLAGFLAGLKITEATEIYDPINNTWSNGAPMPIPVTHMGAVAVDDEIWIITGFKGNHPGVATDAVQIYNTTTNSWSVGPALPNPRGSGAAVYSNGKIHFFGGLLPDRKTDVGEHYILDVNDQSSGWITAAPMPNPRNHLSGAAVNGLIYAIGGQFGHDGGVEDQQFLDVYDPQTDNWSAAADLPSKRSHFEPGTIVHNGKIIIVGGRRGGFFFDDVTQYDPISNSWSELCELPSALLAPSAKVFGDQLIVANGGEGGTCCPLKSTIWLPIEPEVVQPSVSVTGELKKWHKVTLNFSGPEFNETNGENPFLDYRLNVTFTNGSKTYTVPGYFAADGNAANTSASNGTIWKAHFSPDDAGDWSYSASFRKGNIIATSTNANAGIAVGFDGATGSFTISASNKSGRDLRGKGRLQYVGERYLQFAETGDYFIKAGADAPENTLAYEDFDATPNKSNRRKSWQPHAGDFDLADAGDYTWGTTQNDGAGDKGREMLGMLNYLSEEGMNVFSFLTFSLNGDDGNVYPHAQQTPNATDWSNVNHTRFDVSKLDQWEKVLEYADKKGIYIHFKTQETENDQRMDGGQLGTERKLYYRELIARFGHHLALNWNLGEENDIWTELNDPNNEIVRSYAQYISEIDPYQHHIVLHTYPGQQDEVYNPLLGNSSKLTGPSIQSGINSIHNDVKRWVEASDNSGKKWVVTNDEQGSANVGVAVDAAYPDAQLPEIRGAADNRKTVREKVLWGTLMAGGAGVEYYYGYQTGCDDLDCQDQRTRQTKWNDARHALAFFNTYLQDFLVNSASADNLTANTNDYVLAKDGEMYAIYLPNGGTTTIDLAGLSGNFSIQWYNPRTGGLLADGTITTIAATSNAGIGFPPTEIDEDWVALLLPSQTTANLNVLVYHETNGFRHNSISDGIAMINAFGDDLGWTVSDSQDSNVFTTANLEQYDVVVWLNTSGNNLLTNQEQQAFESFIQNNNGYVGVHAATDTYRDGSWSWYNDLSGAIVQTNPNHTANNTNATMTVVNPHPTVSHLDNTWNKNEEYYYWERNGGYLFSGNINLLQVEPTGSNSYDMARPITWYKAYDGGRSFYTALGHNGSDYNTDNRFKTMMREAIIWAAEGGTLNMKAIETEQSAQTNLKLFPNPAKQSVSIDNSDLQKELSYKLEILSLSGQSLLKKQVNNTDSSIDTSSLKPGTYLVFLTGNKSVKKQILIIK